MADETKHTQNPEEKARVSAVEKTPVAKIVNEVSKSDSKNEAAEAKEDQHLEKVIDDKQQLVAEMSERAAKEHKELSSMGDLLFEQQVYARGLVLGIQIALDNMSGEDAPFNKKQRSWSTDFLSRRLTQLIRDQSALKNALDAGEDGKKSEYIEARNSDRLRLILMGLGVMSLKKNSHIQRIGRQEVMKRFFSYAFNSTIELHGKNKGEDSKLSVLNQLYSFTLIDQPKKEEVQAFFSSINMEELNKSDEEEGLTRTDDTESDPRISMYRDVVPEKDKEPVHAKVPPSKPVFSQDTTEKGAKHDVAQRVLQDEAGAQTILKG